MSTNRSTLRGAAVTFAIVGAMIAAYHTYATRAFAPPAPTVVRVANLDSVFNDFKGRAEVDNQLQAMADTFDAELKRQREELTVLEQNVELFAAGSDQRKLAEGEYQQAALNHQAWIEFTAQKLEYVKGEKLKMLYDRIRAGAKALADAQGYELILVDDATAPIGVGPENVVRQQIAARRSLHIAPQIDVTQELVNWLNNQ